MSSSDGWETICKENQIQLINWDIECNFLRNIFIKKYQQILNLFLQNSKKKFGKILNNAVINFLINKFSD